MSQERREGLVIAIPAGPQVPGDPRHSEGSRLAIPTHALLKEGGGLRYSLFSRRLQGLVKGTMWRIVEFRGSDIPKAVADGDADTGITSLDKVLNLPDEEFDENGELKRIKIVRSLGYGFCEFRLGVPEGLGYSEDATIEIAEGLRVGTPLEYLTKRIFKERRVTPAEFVVRDGHIENTILTGRADVIVDIHETGDTMRANGIIPTRETLLNFHAVEIRTRNYLGRSKEEMFERFDDRIVRALENRNAWINSPGNNGGVKLDELLDKAVQSISPRSAATGVSIP